MEAATQAQPPGGGHGMRFPVATLVGALVLLALSGAALAAEPSTAATTASASVRALIPVDEPQLPSEPDTALSTTEQSFGGVIGARAMFWMTNEGNLVEAQDWFTEPNAMSLSRLDVYKNFSNITSLDLKLRSPSDQDLGLGLQLRSLPYFSTQHYFTDSTFRNLPLAFPTQRQHFWGDLDIRKFGQVPASLSYDVNAVRGIGPNRDRDYLDEAYAFDTHAHMPGLDLDIEIPRHDFHDRHDRTNDTDTRSFSLAATKTVMDGQTDVSASYRRTMAYLTTLAREAQTDVYELRGLMYEIFGVEGLKLDTRGSWRDTPKEIALTARTDSSWRGRAVLSLTQNAGYSVQLGKEHVVVDRERLTRSGFDLLGTSAALRRADLAPFRVTDETHYDDMFGRIFFRFRPWASATYYHKERSMNAAPATDLIRNHSPSLVFDREQDKRADLQLQPLKNIGVNFRYVQKRDTNLKRSYHELVRNRQTDFYWLLVNSRLNIGGTFGALDILPSTSDVSITSENATTRGGSISYQLSPELSLFTDFTQIDSEGLRVDRERLTNLGIEAETGTRHRISWRCAYTIDERLSTPNSVEDFDVRGINISGEAQF